MNEHPIIKIAGLTCNFASTQAVRDLSLEVPRGCVYALLGTNGAGKSTTIKTLLNLITPTSGSVQVLGVDAARLGPRELAQIGYVSENQSLPEYLTLAQLVAYCRSLYPTWDDAFCKRLQQEFALPLDRKLSQFSRGMKIKAALLVSLAYRPQLLILDEPFSGLDVLTRDELIQGILELSDQENWTVFLSSHDIDEIERLADWVGLIENGTLRLSEPLETLRGRFRRVDVTVRDAAVLPLVLPENCLLPEASGSRIRWIESRYSGEASMAAQVKALCSDGAAFAVSPLSLREIIVASTRALRRSAPLPLCTPLLHN